MPALSPHMSRTVRGDSSSARRSARLIDHGTDFGISTDSSGRAQVQVLQGEVELQHHHSGETLRLMTRESTSITTERFTPAPKNELEPDRYAFLRGGESQRTPTLTITTAGGTGDAGYAVSPNSPIHHSDILLLVKNAQSQNFLRKAFMRFDLRPLAGRRVADAVLTLNAEATGFGYASLTGAHTFAVYGVTSDAQDDWSADGLTWEDCARHFRPKAAR